MGKEKDKQTTDENGDFVWRFSLDEQPEDAVYEDPLVEMVRAFFADFLNMGHFTFEGRRVDVDGFAFTESPDTVYKVFSATPEKTE